MESLENYLNEIRHRTGIAINPGDPIVALHRFLELFGTDFEAMGDEQRRRFISTLEIEQQKWQDQSRARAEFILEKGLEIAQKQAHGVVEAQAALLCQKINEIFNSRMAELKTVDARLSLLGKLNLVCLGGLFIFFCAMLIFF